MNTSQKKLNILELIANVNEVKYTKVDLEQSNLIRWQLRSPVVDSSSSKNSNNLEKFLAILDVTNVS